MGSFASTASDQFLINAAPFILFVVLRDGVEIALVGDGAWDDLVERTCRLLEDAGAAEAMGRAAARFAQRDLVRYGAGRVAFSNLVKRHIPDPGVVDA